MAGARPGSSSGPGMDGGLTLTSELCEELNFHGVEYIVSVSEAEGQVLVIDVEQKEDGERWRGEFSRKYVEEVTTKTGNFKKFDVFVKMLRNALKQASDAVVADLLTYSDLEMLRSRQTRRPVSTNSKPNNKRYLILTYAVEFDRVHYPLPLAHVDEPPAHALLATIKRLRGEVWALKNGQGNSSSYELEELRREKSELQAALKRAEARASRGAGEEVEALKRERDEAQQFADKMQGEVRRLSQLNDKLASELDGQSGGFERETAARALKESRRRVTELENDLENEREEARQEQGELRRQIVVLEKEASACRQQVTDLKVKVRDLQQELDTARRRSHLTADPRLDGKRQIYTSGSRPSSAERRRPTPPPARPFQRFDPTEYVKKKQAVARARSVSPRPGVPPQRPMSGPSSRPSSAERQRPPWGSGAGGGSRSSSVEKGRPRQTASNERQRPWADPPNRHSSRGATGSRSGSAERQRPTEPRGGGGGSRSSSATRERPWRSSPRSASSDAPSRVASGGGGGDPGARRQPLYRTGAREPPRAAASPRPLGTRSGTEGAGRRAGQGRRVERGDEWSGEEENRRPRGQGAGEETGDEISDIDARLNALQSFLQAAKEKAKGGGPSRAQRP